MSAASADGRAMKSILPLLAITVLLFSGSAVAQEQLTFTPRSSSAYFPPTGASGQTPSGATSPGATDDNGWHLALSPYLWLAGAHGRVGALGRDVSVRASAGDLLSHLDIGLMGAAEARKKRLVLDGDMIWVRVSDSRALPAINLGATSADVRVGQFIWTSKGGFRVIDAKRMKADALVGVRYWHLGQRLTFNPSFLGLSFNNSLNWADVLVGGRIQLPLGQKAVINLEGDAGGWNASAKLDYQYAALLGFRVSRKWTLQAGYRYLYVDYRPGPASIYNTVTSGAVIGATWQIK